MTEISRFWDGNPGIGDGSVAPYDAGTEFAEVMIGVSGSTTSGWKSGVCSAAIGEPNPLWVSAPSPATGGIRVNPGQAIVYGTWYKNDANIDLTLPAPATASRVDLIVVRKVWATQTVRVAVITGVEGGSNPNPTNIVGDTWEMPLAYIAIDTTGNIYQAPSDLRGFAGSSLWFQYGEFHQASANRVIAVRPGAAFAWHADRVALQVGPYASIAAPYSAPGLYLSDNNYVHATGDIAPGGYTYPSARIVMPGNGQIYFDNAAIPAAGSGGALAYVNRLVVAYNGDVHPMSIHGQNCGNGSYPWGGVWTGAVRAVAGTNLSMYGGAGASVSFNCPSGFTITEVDNTINSGHPSYRWISGYFATNPVVGSTLDLKENIVPLDPLACVDAVLNTDWVAYSLRPPPRAPQEIVEDEDDAARDAKELLNAQAYVTMLGETAFSRQQKGYVLQSPDHRVHELFGLIDRRSRSDGADLAVVAAALQQVIRDVTNLKAQIPPTTQSASRSTRGAK